MVLLRQCCCGVSLKKGTLIICYLILAQEVTTLIALICTPDNQPAKSLILRSESNSIRYFQTWSTALNIFIVLTALYGVHKQRVPLMIPFLAYRTVELIFSLFNLFAARDIANNLNETMENSLNNERDETFDTMPLVIVIIVTSSALDFYFLLVTYSYYQIQMMNTTMVAVALPIVSYSVPEHGSMDHRMYPQPAANPYLFDAKVNPFQHYEPYPPPPPGFQHYNSPYERGASTTPMPPPYRP